MDKTEYRFAEARADEGDGRIIQGTLAPYGTDAVIGGKFIERIKAGAFSWDDVTLNVMHDRGRIIARTDAGLTLADGPDRLSVRAELPETRAATEALEAVRAKLLRGFSVEMRVQADTWTQAGDKPLRLIERAVLVGASLVDRPAYRGAEVAARALERFVTEVPMRDWL